jgi:drug/metabolite transporter (DMT)-like permease
MTGILFVILASLFWGVDALIRYPLVDKGINPVTIVFFEHLVLTVFFSFSLLTAIKRIGELRIGDVFSFIMVGGVGSAIATVAFTESFRYLNPSLVILLQKLQPVVAITLATLILKEPVDRKFLIWAAICLFGGILVSSPDIEKFYHLLVNDFGRVVSDNAVRGYSLVAVSIVGWGAATVFGKKLSMNGFEPKAIMAGRFFTGLIFLLPFVEWSRRLILPEGMDYVKILVMVILSGAIAMGLYYQGVKRIPAKTTAIAEMFFPFFAIILNWIFLGKQLNEIQLIGGIILIFGSLVIQWKKY